MLKKLVIIGVAILVVLTLTACGKIKGDMDDMHHSSSGEVPAGLKVADNPTFKVGSQAIIMIDHMKGMDGAKATIVGAYSTTAYAVSYTPTNGGPKETNHKWVITQEIKNAGDQPFKPGDEVTLMADHMEGMNGAEAIIDLAEPTTVYMVDFMPTTGGDMVKNHKWVTESELSSTE
ncbi:YdhK family protein [Paenibacillus lignilyticus]|uniref:YdhK family protein n=1 Tax=Paenibacillus lignilyticus TaxID=1172615 RepID=A0ABS5CAE0_9BACL|nr:YdhK family protein [Paenibacillus lignilyticus]MBP3962969.1 YdhK family protein [Paenibacillus lignilyticus]